MNTQRYLFLEPTLGLPLQPMLAKRAHKEYCFDTIVWLTRKDQQESSRRFFEHIIGTRFTCIDDMVTLDENLEFKSEAIEFASEALATIGSESQGLHEVTFDDVPIGLYLVSFLQRHNNELCKSWSLPKANIKNALIEWSYFALIIRSLASQNADGCAGIFTHHVYFFGFLSELLHKHGVKSVTYGSAGVPLFKTGLNDTSSYDWSMGGSRQCSISIPSSCYEHSQPQSDSVRDYVSFVKKSCESKVSEKWFSAILQTSNYKQIDLFLKKNNINAWRYDGEHPCADANADMPHFCFYLHSFSDSTFTYDYDSFDTLMDYYLFIARTLADLYPNAQFYVRPHPNVFSHIFNDRIERDIELTIHFMKQMMKCLSNITFVFPTVSNKSFYSLSEKSIVVTHHSPSMALEATYSDRIAITSYSSIKIALRSPLILPIGKKSLHEDVKKITSVVSRKPSISWSDKVYLISNAVPKLFYNPVYDNKIPRSHCMPALLAGYEDLHKELAPNISKEIMMHSFLCYQAYEDFVATRLGNLAYKHMLKEINYTLRMLDDKSMA